MALLHNEDFAIWYLRTSYLAHVKDGIGERLIDVNSSILNTPGFRAAGWSTDPIQRTYSPPIPTAVTSDYFRSGATNNQTQADDEDEGGMVTGRTSNDTIGPGPNARRRRRKEQLDDDDSSDLSDESEDEVEGTQRAAQQIRFAKMPARHRADSSPIRNAEGRAKPDVMVTEPSKPTEGRRRTGSLGAVEAVKARARRDTATSSELSSENEVDPNYFQRRQIGARRPEKPNLLTRIMSEEDVNVPMGEQDDSDVESVGSALSSDLGDTVDSSSVLKSIGGSDLPSLPPTMKGFESQTPQAESPKRSRTLPLLQALPPPRPISFVQPASLLSAALRAQRKAPHNPIQRFAELSGKGSPNPLWIKIYLPFSEDPEEPFEMPLDKVSKDGNLVIVAEAIGLSLWRYVEEERVPPLRQEQLNVNKWTLRMVEDGEVDYDFQALGRTRPVTDFTSNNNRGARGRSREKPFDDFALVEASAQEFEVNNRETPQFTPEPEAVETPAAPAATQDSTPSLLTATSRTPASRSNLLLASQPFASALSNTSLTPADRPAPAVPQATQRTGISKAIRVRYFDLDVTAQTTTMDLPMDSYIAEILDHVCKRWNLDKAGFLLKVSGTNTVAPLDRTIEALGSRSDLDLVRKRFGAGPVSHAGSPGSFSPNAPLLLDIQGPRKGKNKQTLLPVSQKQDLMSSASNFKKYYVTRKQLTSFTQGSQRVLIFDGDYLHVMPADTGKTLFDNNTKTSSIAFSSIIRSKVSTKHPRLVRVVVRRANESKRYDFEARTAGEAQEIVDDILREIRLARP